MAKAGPSRSITSSLLVAALALAACARSAPDLPAEAAKQQGGPVDTAACADIDRQITQLAARMDGLEAPIEANRTSNQVNGYFGAFLLVPLVGLQSNSSEKQSLDAAQRERDRLIAQRSAAACPPPATDGTGRIRPAAAP